MPATLAELGAAIFDRLRGLDEAITAAREIVMTSAVHSAETAEPFIGKQEAATFLRSELKRWRERWRVGTV